MDDAPQNASTGKPAPANSRLLIAGGVLALVAGVAIAVGLLNGHRNETAAPPASQAGLVIEASGAGDGRLDPARPLRCFVDGQPVGELTLADCARRNGVATDALDVGIDESGALAAAGQAGTVLTPLPPTAEAAPAEAAPAEAPAVEAQPAEVQPTRSSGACWRYQDNQWKRLPGDVSLSACLTTLYAGRCERPGGATYGRWSQQTLRLVPGRVEISGDNRRFRTLVQQSSDCTTPNIG
jgi:hypothetical protein